MASFETWKVGEAETEDGLLLVRVRAAAPPPMKRAKLPHLIMIGWAYEGDAGGMPPADELAQMEAFEAAVDKGLETEGAGVAVACVTGQGAREWRYYTADPDVFMDALNEALDGHPDYPIDFKAFEDPEWEALSELLDEE